MSKIQNVLKELDYSQLKSWLDIRLNEFNEGLPDNNTNFSDKSRLDYLYNLWVEDDSGIDSQGFRENLDVLELLDAHIKFGHPTFTICDNGRLKMLYNLIKDGEMKLLSYRMNDI
jgi:hypothetical protein